MVRGIVYDQYDGATFRYRLHQMLDKGTEGDGVFIRAGHENDLVCPPIVSTD